MRYMVGYQQRLERRFVELLLRHREHLGELYFAWPDIPSGRGTMDGAQGVPPWEVHSRLLADLGEFSQAGVALNLLLNGNCYGQHSQSRLFFQKIGQVVDLLAGEYSLTSITTASPLIAKFIKQNFPELECRASVNMEIGTCEGMDYLADCFDGYYVRRELNRDFPRLQQLRRWCLERGKRLYGLANSGCLNNCSAHNFHDNLVAHEREISQMDNGYEFTGICRQWLGKEPNRRELLRVSNFIRPEDVGLYEEFFDGMKLATRVHPNPCGVVSAYFSGSWHGNVLELLEPNHAGVFHPWIVDNDRLPRDFGERLLHCGKDCSQCDYCARAMEESLVDLSALNVSSATGKEKG